jgi:hypothetical protein
MELVDYGAGANCVDWLIIGIQDRTTARPNLAFLRRNFEFIYLTSVFRHLFSVVCSLTSV